MAACSPLVYLAASAKRSINLLIRNAGAFSWERNITRFNDEPEWLYRKRVAYAFVNAADAGSNIGFIKIMQRLGLSVISLKERQPNIDWDVISVELDDKQLSNARLVHVLIQDYGRTCRRYEYVSTRLFSNAIRVDDCHHDFQTLHVRSAHDSVMQLRGPLTLPVNQCDNDISTLTVRSA